MIDRAASLISNRLNQYVAAATNAPEPDVVLMNVHDGAAPVAEAQDKLAVFVVNISQDTISRKAGFKSGGASVTREQAPLNLYIHLMVAANFEPTKYSRALNTLSLAVQFFQANPIFDPRNAPEMNGSGIEKLSVEMESLDLEGMSNVWGVLGGRYLPSVLYRIRTVSIDSGAVIAVDPVISGIGPEVGT